VFALAAVTTSVASSQTPTAASLDVRPGDRVRVLAAESSDTALIGTIAAVRGDGIVFRPEHQHDTSAIPFAHLRQLDVSQGRSAHPVAGLLIGLAAGAVGGAVLGEASSTPANNGFREAGTVGGAVLGGAAGALIGVVTGASIHTERWRTVPLHSLVDHEQAGVNLIPSSMGPRLAVRVAVRF
jgi:hypothetical protein